MTKDSQGNSPPENEGTRVDLGDDLLEKTGTHELFAPKPQVASGDAPAPAPAPPPASGVGELDDQFHSARILLNEGLSEEAKKVLRHIVIADPNYAPARKLLAEIHELELKQIFGEDRRRPGLGREAVESPFFGADADEVLRQLDRDLSLGILSGKPEGSTSVAPFALEPESPEMREYIERLEGELVDLSGRDRMDLGIGFLEMGLHELAIRQFRGATAVYLRDSSSPGLELLAATALLAHACIQAGKAFEATLILQGVLRDAEVPIERKVEFFYQMGRAYEAMGKQDLAATWYDQARGIDPRYRDLDARARGKR
ncbi:MAG: hypothetical protein NDJ89_01575 [Oligoflexia bacterium]|nr:hypothetical protein [Oligoflexia bacterium]